MSKAMNITAPAAGALVSPSKGTPRTGMGLRSTRDQFRLLHGEVMTGLLLHSDVFFHHRVLQRNLLLQEAASLLSALAEIITATADLRLPDPPNPDASGLSRALKALGRDVPDPLSSEAAAFAAQDITRYVMGSGLLSPRDRADVSARSRAEAQADLTAPLAEARASWTKLQRGLKEFSEAADWFNVNTLQRAVGPAVMARAEALLRAHKQRTEEGNVLAQRQEEVLKLLTVPATMKALRGARHPLSPLVSDAFPPKSSLEVRALPPLLPATVIGSRSPDALPVGATLIYTPNGKAQRTIELVGAGQHRVEAEIPGETYEVVEGVLLVEVEGLLRDIPLTTGPRTAAQVLDELNSGMQRYGGLAKRSLGKLMLLDDDPMVVGDAGQVVRESYLQAEGTFPMALEGLTLSVFASYVHTATDTPLPPGLYAFPRSILFPASPHGVGNPYESMQEVVDAMLAWAPFVSGDLLPGNDFVLEVEVVDGKLEIRAPIATGPNTFLELLLPFSSAHPATLNFPEVIRFGWTDYSASDRLALGFGAGQASTDYFALENVVALVEEAESASPEVEASISTSVRGIGRGHFSTQTRWVPNDATRAQAGDILNAVDVGLYVVTSLVGEELVVAPLHDRLAPLHLETMSSLQRTLLQLTSLDDSLASHIQVDVGTAHAQLGLVSGSTPGTATTFEVYGRLAGEKRRAVRDLGVLKALKGAWLANGEDRYSITAISKDRRSFEVGEGVLASADLEVLSSLATEFEELRVALRALQMRPLWKWVLELEAALQRVEAASQGAASTHQLLDAVGTVYAAAMQIGEVPGQGPAAALQRLGLRVPAAPAGTLFSVLTSWVPEVPEETQEQAEAQLSALEERGYDRFRSLLVRGKYHVAASLRMEGASSASSAEEKLTKAARLFQPPRGAIGGFGG